MALTATATERVRIDIVKQLKLREPRCYVASFNRPNLTYRVVPKSASYEQLLAFHPQPGERERHCLLREPKRRGLAGGSVVRRWDQREAVSRGTHDQRTHPESGTFSSG